MKRLTFISVAEVELAEAAVYYDEQQAGLGKDFLDEVGHGLSVIVRNPEAWPYYGKPVRGYRLKSFPYRLLYRELADRLQVVAVMHLSRRPGYWKGRVK